VETKQLSPSEVRRLVDGLRVTVDFIRSNIPADVIATKQTYGWERANAALKLKPKTTKNLTKISEALVWAFYFITQNYEGPAAEISDAILLLDELGFLKREVNLIHRDHLTRQ
jgi:hypothetical protein